LLAGVDGEANELVGVRAAGFPLELVIVDTATPIDPSVLVGAAAAIVQVTDGDERSIARFKQLAEGPVPLIAAAYEPSMKLVRALVRAGAHDVVPLPLDREELETALDPIHRMAIAHGPRPSSARQKIVTVIKSEGGIGATALLTQLARRFAVQEAAAGREACLIDLDIQFGNAALQLGLQPALTFKDLVEAGKRLDGDLLRSTAIQDSSGLKVIPAPHGIMPLELLTSDQLLSIMDIALGEFGTVFVDLPANWTNWSLSLLARSDLVLLVTELRVPSLHRARRQLDLLVEQGLSNLDVRIVVNRSEKGFFRNLSEADAERVLKRPVSYCIANDHETMTQAIDRGIPIEQVKRKSALSRDIDTMERGVAGALGLER